MRKIFMLCVLVIASLFLLLGCEQISVQSTEMDADKAAGISVSDPVSIRPVREKLIRDVGIIRYIDLEGGFYGIIGKRGNYDPVNLPREFQQDGLRVRFTARVCKDLASIHMWGTIIEIISMQTIRSQPQLVMDTGVMHQYMIQGAPWIIEATTGGYQPINLPREFTVENLKVRFVGRIRTDIVIIPALWPLVELTTIERIGDDPIIVSLEQEFKLPVGRSALVPVDEVLLTFKSVVRDSRCPIDSEV